MSNCEFAGDCAFFKGSLPSTPDNYDALKAEYCEGNTLHCARYMVATALGAEKMPDSLMPTDRSEAYGIIAKEG